MTYFERLSSWHIPICDAEIGSRQSIPNFNDYPCWEWTASWERQTLGAKLPFAGRVNGRQVLGGSISSATARNVSGNGQAF